MTASRKYNQDFSRRAHQRTALRAVSLACRLMSIGNAPSHVAAGEPIRTIYSFKHLMQDWQGKSDRFFLFERAGQQFDFDHVVTA
jgi:hypothetical protein